MTFDLWWDRFKNMLSNLVGPSPTPCKFQLDTSKHDETHSHTFLHKCRLGYFSIIDGGVWGCVRAPLHVWLCAIKLGGRGRYSHLRYTGFLQNGLFFRKKILLQVSFSSKICKRGLSCPNGLSVTKKSYAGLIFIQKSVKRGFHKKKKKYIKN